MKRNRIPTPIVAVALGVASLSFVACGTAEGSSNSAQAAVYEDISPYADLPARDAEFLTSLDDAGIPHAEPAKVIEAAEEICTVLEEPAATLIGWEGIVGLIVETAAEGGQDDFTRKDGNTMMRGIINTYCPENSYLYTGQ